MRHALGHSIHQFHNDPERIRTIFRTLMADPGREHSTELTLGGVTFSLSFTPVYDRVRARSWLSTPHGATSAMRNWPSR